MDTTRFSLRYLLTAALVMFLICGFTVTPIAAAEYTMETRIDAKLTTGDDIVKMSTTLRDGLFAAAANAEGEEQPAANAEETRLAEEPTVEYTETYTADDIAAYTADHPDIEVEVNGHTIDSDGIVQGAANHPNATIESTTSVYTQYTRANAPEDADYAIVEIVIGDSQNATAELSQWEETWFFGMIDKKRALYAWTDNGTVIFKIPSSDYHKFNKIYVVDYIDTSETFGGMCGDGWGARGCQTRNIIMPQVGETLTVDIPSIYDYRPNDSIKDALKMLGFCVLVIVLVFAIALILEYLMPYVLYYGGEFLYWLGNSLGWEALAEAGDGLALTLGLFLGFIVD